MTEIQPETPQNGPTDVGESSTPATSAPQANQKSSRKRTKTGCLTCRKRRIKCGEERPTCSNCVKSKRNCEGYNQRVIFKHPVGGLGIPGNGLDPNHSTVLDLAIANAYPPSMPFNSLSASNPSLHPIAPRPLYQIHPNYPRDGHQYFGATGAVPSEAVPMASLSIPSNVMPSGLAQMWSNQGGSQGLQGPNYGTHSHAIPHVLGSGTGNHIQADYLAQASGNAMHPTLYGIDRPQPPHRHSISGHESIPWMTSPQSASHTALQQTAPQQFLHRDQSSSCDDWQSITPPLGTAANGQPLSSDTVGYREIHAQLDSLRKGTSLAGGDPRRYSAHGFVQRPSFDTSIPTPFEAPPPPVSNVDEDEDEDEHDPWDVEMELDESTSHPPEQASHDLSLMLVRHATQEEARIRTFTTFLNEPNVLATYRPSHKVSPLTDEKAARIFCHFITATGPSLSIYERQSSSSSVMFSKLPVPASQKALWTHTMPSIALNHPPLMHAMLALGALHVAKLQQTSEGPSIKHFTYALRRVSKLIGLPKRRNEIATLAANLLVGFYEVMLAEHSKWNIHLSGARILIMEIDFAGMTGKIREMRARAKARVANTPVLGYEDYIRVAGIPESLLPDKDWEIDEALISGLTGFHIQYDKHWQAKTEQHVQNYRDLSEKDIEDYKVQSDLYWWYCKQDIFQGMVSGNRLLLPYEHWAYCPPRGQIGRLDATYATFDHLCLIMARLTDFGGKDQLRKRRVIAAQGGQWRPPPDFFGPGRPPRYPGPGNPTSTESTPTKDIPSARTGNPSSNDASQPSTTSNSRQRSPPYGMMPPPTGPVRLHSAYDVMSANLHNSGMKIPSPPKPATPSEDLESETAAAIAEHAAIITAFDLFNDSLGVEYQALSADTAPPISTPFGPALQYRTHPIACIWTFYYAGRILLHRLHPHMPPAAMVSANVCAHLTANYAQTIGKICAGLYYPQQYNLQTGALNPNLGAALMESTFTLFFAAVQFTDAGQRGWTISKLRDIARLTGWQTSAAVAAGCEVAWESIGLAGKGPKYTPTMDRDNKDERVSRKIRRTMYSQTNGTDATAPAAEESKDVKEADQENSTFMINHDRRYINVNPNARVHWALGILSVEDDIKKLDLNQP